MILVLNVVDTCRLHLPRSSNAPAKLKNMLENHPKYETGTRPADLYRTYVKVLRFLRKKGYLKAGAILRELMLESTLPVADLDNPDHIGS
jgi:hypothetical protein